MHHEGETAKTWCCVQGGKGRAGAAPGGGGGEEEFFFSTERMPKATDHRQSRAHIISAGRERVAAGTGSVAAFRKEGVMYHCIPVAAAAIVTYS